MGQLDREGYTGSLGKGLLRLWKTEDHSGPPNFVFKLGKNNHYEWVNVYPELAALRDCSPRVEAVNSIVSAVATGSGLATTSRDHVPVKKPGSFQGGTAEGVKGLNRLQIAHISLGHPSLKRLHELVVNDSVRGLGINPSDPVRQELGNCDACIRGKTTAMHIGPSTESFPLRSDEVHLHMDIRPMPIPSVQGNEYVTLIVEQPTDMIYAYYTKTKTGQHKILKNHYEHYVNPRRKNVAHVTTDDEAIYKDPVFRQVVTDLGAQHHTSPPHRHEMNGVVERAMRTVLDCVRTVMAGAEAPPGHWQYACDYALWNLNRTTVKGPNGETPYELSTGMKPDVSIARPFGAVGWRFVHEDEPHRGKRTATGRDRGVMCRMIGYAEDTPGAYLLLDGDNVVRKRLQFICKGYEGLKGLEGMAPEVVTGVDESGDQLDWPNLRRVPLFERPATRSTTKVATVEDEYSADEDDDDDVPDYASHSDDDESVFDITDYQDAFDDEEEVKTADSKEPSLVTGCDKELPPTPANDEEADQGPYCEYWQKSRETELDAIHNRVTYVVVKEVPPGFKALKAKFNYKVTPSEEDIANFKSRMCVKGCAQVPFRDYEETYSPTVMYKTIMIVLAIAATEDMEIETADVGNAYLLADIDKEIYMELPRILWDDPKKPKYVRLLKALYGLKQAGELWNETINKFLVSIGFKRCLSDVCLYVHSDTDSPHLYICVYVDDILIAAVRQEDIDWVKGELVREFKKMKLPGPIKRFLGLEFKRDREHRTILVTQEEYIRKIVKKNLTPGARTAVIPGNPAVNLHTAERGTGSLQSEVGQLRYGADRVRSDILASVNLLSKVAACPGPEHIKAAYKVFQYLEGTAADGLTLGGEGPIVAVAYCDASFIAEGDSKSQYGYAIHLSRKAGAVITKAKSATQVHHHPSEAETYAVDEVCKEIEWVRLILEELGYPQKAPTVINTDSSSTIDTVSITGNFQRQKQYNRNINYIRELIANNVVVLNHISGEEQHADMLTKNLAVQKHSKFKRRMMQSLDDI